ncbi:Nicotinate-nucleotide adenylyltransferase [subsurface metagenome]
MKIAVIGGTFNPIHAGHLFLCEEVRLQYNYERIIFIPANLPVHKELTDRIDPLHRLEMVKIATAPYADFVVDDCELSRGGNSYMIETMTDIIRRYSPKGKPGLIIGDDLAKDFFSWKDAHRLSEMVDLIIAHRLTASEGSIDFPCKYVDNLLFSISSTEIRQRIKEGRAVSSMLPDKVLSYIKQQSLYK